MAVNHFHDLYSEQPRHGVKGSIFNGFPALSSLDFQRLMALYSENEDYSALKQMDPFKALEVDGYQAICFQQLWGIVEDFVQKFASDFFNGDQFPPDNSEMLLVLVPKMPNPESLHQYRPIRLCTICRKGKHDIKLIIESPL